MTSILVASPDQPLMHALTRLLTARHHTVEVAGLEAADAHQALDATSDVAVVDLRAAPTTTQAAVVRRFHEHGARVLVLLDATASASDVQAAVRAGADAALPIAPDELEDAADLAELLAIGAHPAPMRSQGATTG